MLSLFEVNGAAEGALETATNSPSAFSRRRPLLATGANETGGSGSSSLLELLLRQPPQQFNHSAVQPPLPFTPSLIKESSFPLLSAYLKSSSPSITTPTAFCGTSNSASAISEPPPLSLNQIQQMLFGGSNGGPLTTPPSPLMALFQQQGHPLLGNNGSIGSSALFHHQQQQQPINAFSQPQNQWPFSAGNSHPLLSSLQYFLGPQLLQQQNSEATMIDNANLALALKLASFQQQQQQQIPLFLENILTGGSGFFPPFRHHESPSLNSLASSTISTPNSPILDVQKFFNLDLLTSLLNGGNLSPNNNIFKQQQNYSSTTPSDNNNNVFIDQKSQHQQQQDLAVSSAELSQEKSQQKCQQNIAENNNEQIFFLSDEKALTKTDTAFPAPEPQPCKKLNLNGCRKRSILDNAENGGSAKKKVKKEKTLTLKKEAENANINSKLKRKHKKRLRTDSVMNSPVNGMFILEEPPTNSHSSTIKREESLDESAPKTGTTCEGELDESASYVHVSDESRAAIRAIPNIIGDPVCCLCKVRYEDVFKLAMHRCPRIGYVEHRCEECNKSFHCPANLASHYRWHPKEKEERDAKAGNNDGRREAKASLKKGKSKEKATQIKTEEPNVEPKIPDTSQKQTALMAAAEAIEALISLGCQT